MIESQVIKEWTALARQEGILEGKKEGILEGKKEGILEGKKEGILEGKKEGILEGKKESRVEYLLLALKRLTPQVPSDLEETINAITDMPRLRALFDEALAASSLEEFRRSTGL